MNNRQIELQVIIRNLENKILILKEQNKIIGDRWQTKMRQQSDDYLRSSEEKDRLIEFLKIEVSKDRQISVRDQHYFDSSRSKEREDSNKELEKYRNKCSQLEKKIQKVTENYELKQKKLEGELHQAQEKHQEVNLSRGSLVAEVEKLNKFYVASRIQIPKRKETVEWIDKLTAFLSKNQIQSQKHNKELYSFFKNSLESFKTEIAQSVKSACDLEESMMKDRKQVLAKINQIVSEMNEAKNEISEDNDKFWEAIRKQKMGNQQQKIQELEREYNEQTNKLTTENQELMSRIKSLQSERKTLLLGFTQLKTLYESREKTYRQEIASLKQTIQNFITNGSERELEFEKQTKILHNQLSSLSERYYENIEVPLYKMSNKLEGQIKGARLQLQKLSENKNFVKMVQSLQSVIQKYFVESNDNAKIGSNLRTYIQKTTQLLERANEIGDEQAERVTNDQLLFSRNTEFELKVSQVQDKLSSIKWKQRQNKYVYEVSTLKKHNTKLKQYCQSLQNKMSDPNKTSAIKASRVSSKQTKNQYTSFSLQKVLQLEMEVQKLTAANNAYSQQFLYQINAVKQHVHQISGKSVKDKKQIIDMQKTINSISQFNEQLVQFLDRQNQHMDQIKKMLNHLNVLLVKPVDKFDWYVSQISGCCKEPQLDMISFKSMQKSNNSQNIFQKLRATYAQIAVKRQQNTLATSKLVTELIKTLRETSPVVSRPRLKPQIGNNNENVDKQKQQLEKSRLWNKETANLQKKIKELQSTRIKSREEVIRRIQKIEEMLKGVEAKYQKRTFYGVVKIQQFLQKKYDEMDKKSQEKVVESTSELSQITVSALKQLKLKLKQSLTENQGLAKEIECLQSIKTKQRGF